MSKMSLTRRSEVIRVKLWATLGSRLHRPLTRLASLTSYVGRECPACMILTRRKSALQRAPVWPRIKHQKQALGSLAPPISFASRKAVGSRKL
jgi:hypothetical protein